MLTDENSTFDALDRLAATAQRTGRAPSLVLAVGRNGRRVRLFSHGSGAGERVQYRIGSITKTFTAALILQLRDAGELGLRDPLTAHLPEVPIGPVTLRQLLSHSAGLQAEPEGPWWERSPGVDVPALLAGLSEDKRPLPPGRFRHYSNLGFALLGAVVERRTGVPWAQRLRTHLLEPAGLADTGYFPREPYARGHLIHPWTGEAREEPTPDTRAMAPAGQLWSTADDLIRWGAVLAGQVPAVLPTGTAEEMRTVVAMADNDSWRLGTGLGVQLDRHGDRLFAGHAGSMPGFVANLAVHPQTGWSTVAFANCYTGPRVTALSHKALAHVLDLAEEPEPAWEPRGPVPPELAGLTGRWWWMGTEATVSYDGRLYLEADGERDHFEPIGPDRWRGVEGGLRGEVLRVERAADGTPVALDVATYIHVRDPWPHEPR